MDKDSSERVDKESIERARNDFARLLVPYEKRDANYTASRSSRAKKQEVASDREVIIAKSKLRTLKWFAIISGAITIFSVPFSIYLWALAHDEYCKLHGNQAVLGIICPKNIR